ncbi:unnamed protein product [Brachionus calyciflorus]|uniref:Uncharacterized protein n=1 Tax=Brachionus calyciflorus TaxID=104777 RepID=A0A813V229_9BILA|nr:unnamed protein product [Brachionus calyciflorus]
MSFNFERDHSEILSKISDSAEYKYLREFYLRLNSRGIYTKQINNRQTYQPIEDYLNSNSPLSCLSCNSILNTNDENFIKYTIDTVPKNLYKTLLKCSLLTMNDYAIYLLINNWPFPSLELGDYFKEAYSSLLLFYNTDINSYTGKIAPEILKWLLIGTKYTKLVTKLFLKNQTNENYKLKNLDITGLPISNSLLKTLLKRYYNSINGLLDESDFDMTDESDFSVDLFSSSDSSDISLDTYDTYDSSSTFSEYEDSDMDTEDDSDESDSSDSSINTDTSSECSEESDKHKKMKIPDDKHVLKYQIKLDLILVKKNHIDKFEKILKAKSKDKNRPENGYYFELIYNKLDMTIKNRSYCIIDETFDLNALEITGLGIFFSANFNEVMYTSNLIKKFKNIQDLNLSAFGRESLLNTILDNGSTTEALKNSLSELKNLKRLRLNIPGCKNKLKLLLENLSRPLEYLNLTSCGLNENDLKFLMESIHVNTIDNLVLSNNDLNAHSDAIICLLKKMKSNLHILDLGCNSFSFDVYYKILNEGISCLTNLRLLVTLDVFTFENYLRIAERLSFLRKFISWRINYSSDYYEKSRSKESL